MPALYGQSTIETLLSIDSQRFLTWVEIRDGGVWVQASLERDLPLRFSWTYAMDLDQLDGPDPKKGLALSFDFTAEELGAFMLDGGAGIALTSVFGGFDEGPYESSLSAIPGVDSYRAAHALRSAYQAIRDAEAIVGKLEDNQLRKQEEAQMLLLELQEAEEEQVRQSTMTNKQRLPLLKQSHARTSELSTELSRIRRDRDEHYFAWRKKMVTALLRPELLAAEHGGDGLVLRISHVLDDIERIEGLRNKAAAASTTSFDEIDRQEARIGQLRSALAAARQRLAWLEALGADQEVETAKRRHAISVLARLRRGDLGIPGSEHRHWDAVAATSAAIDTEMISNVPSTLDAGTLQARPNDATRSTVRQVPDWWSHVSRYVLQKQKASHFRQAKALYYAMEAEAGELGSPFRRGIEENRGKLVVAESAQPVALKTFQNFWSEMGQAVGLR